MRITTLHVENLLSFSSFDLQFHQGLNVIVGPNGAGKSNILRLVALIRTALDIARGVPGAEIKVRRYLRIGATQEGKVSLGIELTEETECRLVVSYVRALVASSMDRKQADSPSVEGTFEELVAARVRQAVGRAQVESLLRGRLVLWLDGGPPETISFAYEFDHEGVTFHYGIMGARIPNNWVAKNPVAPSMRTSWGGKPLDLSQPLSGIGPMNFAFGDLLAVDTLIPWEIRNHPTGSRLLLSEELARSLVAGPDLHTNLSFGFVLYRAVRDRLVLTENLRRPPRSVYELSEVDLPVSLDDAGDLPLELYRRKVGQLPEDRRAFQAIRELFRELTGDEFDVTAQVSPVPTTERASFIPQLMSSAEYPISMAFQQVSRPPAHELRIEVVVPVGAGQVSVQLAGAGVWEALVASAVAVPVPGRVLLLDEPAVNLHRHLAAAPPYPSGEPRPGGLDYPLALPRPRR